MENSIDKQSYLFVDEQHDIVDTFWAKKFVADEI